MLDLMIFHPAAPVSNKPEPTQDAADKGCALQAAQEEWDKVETVTPGMPPQLSAVLEFSVNSLIWWLLAHFCRKVVFFQGTFTS